MSKIFHYEWQKRSTWFHPLSAPVVVDFFAVERHTGRGTTGFSSDETNIQAYYRKITKRLVVTENLQHSFLHSYSFIEVMLMT